MLCRGVLQTSPLNQLLAKQQTLDFINKKTRLLFSKHVSPFWGFFEVKSRDTYAV